MYIIMFKEAAEKTPYRRGSIIPLEEMDKQGIVKTSSRGRIIVPPLRYWLGKLLALSNTVFVFVPMRSYHI